MIFCTKLHLDESKKMFQADFWKKFSFFKILAKNGQFLPFLAIFSQKISFSDIFFETAHQICLKLGQKLGTIALYHLKAVLCPGKFLFWPFWPFFGQKYIACGDIIWFWAVLGHFLPNRWSFFVNFWSLGFSRKAYGFTLVRACVRASVRTSVTPYLEIRASDFDDFLHKPTSQWV